MRAMMRILALWMGLITMAGAASAQGVASLIADRVAIEADGTLVAEGKVEILFDGYRMLAERVVYDRTADQLNITGPMRIVTQSGSVITAETAQINADLSEGLLRSARLVLDQQLQLAAAEILRVDGRYTVLDKTVASSCTICRGNPVPLWQIRASRVVHDTLEQQLFFDHPRFEIAGVPVFYLPRLRLPDPTLKRANGFLTPEVRINDQVGVGLKLPYFLTLGRHADLTLTPYLAHDFTRTLELRLRKAFRHGDVEFNGALSRDDVLPGETRQYLFGEGQFDLPRDFKLRFNIEAVSDPAYLLEYDYSDADRLDSFVEISRTKRNSQINASVTHYYTLRSSESNADIPSLVTAASWEHQYDMPGIGGVATLGAELFAFERTSDIDITGRDQARLSLNAGWRRDWLFGNGLQLAAQSELALDYYSISDDSGTASPITRLTPFVATELRWPWARGTQGGGYQVLEPVVQLVWSDMDNATVPNEDSTSVSFDEGNLFSLSRFAGSDVYEEGLRANLGLSWTHYAPQGWSTGVTVGRIVRDKDLGQFSNGSGLSGGSSDWLLATQIATADNLKFTNRAIFDDQFTFTRNELRMDWVRDRLDLSSSYIWQQADVTDNRPNDTSEWDFDMAYRLDDNWTGKADWRYDFVSGRAAEAGVGLEYQNECVTVDLSLSRRFTSSTSVNPSTDFGLTISLNGFGNRVASSSYRRSCIR
ncbi:organic solvent tolerance protein [Actibacterium atlanticum]|uniref:LPS-assembly protein LptD n=1 Tax=Actibacterium atlanticum TaxID=1461693 RepID=A0A058ZRM9_9RHOB|nr:LPS assembly protein LptD [Actibacterium atlanticum]KCV83807.1 organic solvent tolerance protein [Actibacterium atlanticum]